MNAVRLALALAMLACLGAWSLSRGGAAAGPAEDPQAEPGAPDSGVYDELEFLYRDPHEDQRAIAQVDLVLRQVEGGLAELSLKPRAQAPRLDPVRGLRGLRGGNSRTALELEQLLGDEALEVSVRPVGGDQEDEVAGTVGDPWLERMRERRLLPDGSMDWDARSEKAWPVAVKLSTPAMPAGRWEAVIRARGRVRLVAEYEHDGQSGRILSVRGSAEPGEPEVTE